MKFTKMQGIGNDYVYVDCMTQKIEDPSRLSVWLSERHFGVGSDGLICISSSENADFRMDIYNADGSRAEMCGNGIRCVGKYVYDKGLTKKTHVAIETMAGIKFLELHTENGKVSAVTVDMGKPVLEPEKIPVKAEGTTFIDRSMEVCGRSWRVTCVSMGNPHAVVYMKDIEQLEISTVGPEFENNQLFPNRINTEFVEVIDSKTLKMRVWERGSGETLACGTGACAVLVSSVLNGFTGREATVHLRGGDLRISWNETDNHVYMTGPAVAVFDGELI